MLVITIISIWIIFMMMVKYYSLSNCVSVIVYFKIENDTHVRMTMSIYKKKCININDCFTNINNQNVFKKYSFIFYQTNLFKFYLSQLLSFHILQPLLYALTSILAPSITLYTVNCFHIMNVHK